MFYNHFYRPYSSFTGN